MIPCCECGVLITPNAEERNMCARCQCNHIDFTAGRLPKQSQLFFCRNCERYLQPPAEWITAARESRELLALCLAQLKKLNRHKDLKLADAGFVWTEPHSKRLRVKLTVHGQLSGGMLLQQVCYVEFTVTNQMCDDCHKTEAKDFWRCLVQVRQRAENKKTFYYLEQLILKHKAHGDTLGIKPQHGGLDFYYASEKHARKFVDFLQNAAPVKVTMSKHLMSQDVHTQCCDYRHTWSVEIVPLSTESLVCLSSTLRQQLGNLCAICLVHKVAGGIHFIDPLTAQTAEMAGNAFFRTPFEAICNPKQLLEYVVMDVELLPSKERSSGGGGKHAISDKHALCDIWLVRSTELGCNEHMIHTRSHLGHLLHVGDSVLGYNVAEANINNLEFEKLPAKQVPDVVLVRKISSIDRETRSRQRQWRLKHLTVAVDSSDVHIKHDYDEFLEELEQNAEQRKNINIYRDAAKMLPASTVDDVSLSNDDGVVLVSEMLEDCSLNCVAVNVDNKVEDTVTKGKS